MTYKCNTFSTGTNGAAIATGTTGFYSHNVSAGASAVFDTASATGTALGILLTSGTANAVVSVRNLFSASNVEQEIRESFTVDNASYSAEMRMINFRTGTNAATNAAVYLTLGVNKKLKLYDASGVAVATITSTALPTGEYDYYCYIKAATVSTGRVIVNVYAKGSNTALYTYDSGTTLNLGTIAFTGYDAGLISPTAESHTYRMSSPQSNDGTAINLTALTGPTAAFTTTYSGLQVTAVGTSTTVGAVGTTITAYDWNWGDGTAHGTGASPAAHTYSAAGSYTITLTVTDSNGLTSTATSGAATNPTARFTATHSGLVASVDGSTSTVGTGGATIASYSWDWGDGTTSVYPNDLFSDTWDNYFGGALIATASHTYTTAATYLVTLTVTDSNGLTGTYASQLTVASGTGTSPPASTTVDVNYAKWMAEGMTVGALTRTATSMVVTTAATKPRLSTDGSDYPMDTVIGEEVVTVEAAPSSSTSPQTVTITRGARGTPAAAHATGSSLNLWPQLTWAL